MRRSGLGPLSQGSTVVVIGGGPAGVATAIALKREGRAMGKIPRVIIVEGKQFVGEQHYNMCSGVLSPPIADLLEKELLVPFPRVLSRGDLTTYVLHTARRQIVLDGECEPSTILRRVQFDAYMLQAARERGAEVMRARVTDIEFHADRVVIYTDSNTLEADVVVGAFGLDEGSGALFTRAVGYHPPPALSSVVTKYHPGMVAMREFGCRIHAFLPASTRIEFGAITPKGSHLTINIGGATVDADQMDAFLSFPEVRSTLPGLENAGRFNAQDFKYFRGRFPRGLARNFTGDRFVMVGDAAGMVRAFKGKGVTSAVQTGIRAAQVILREGISASAFMAYHAANRDITEDLPYGQAMRRLTIVSSFTRLMDVVIRAAQKDATLRQALFEAVSGNQPYRDVIRLAFSPNSVLAMASTLVREVVPPARGR